MREEKGLMERQEEGLGRGRGGGRSGFQEETWWCTWGYGH